MAQVIVSVNLPPAQAVTGIGDLIRPFATSSHGVLVSHNECPSPEPTLDPGEVHRCLYQLGRQMAARSGGIVMIPPLHGPAVTYREVAAGGHEDRTAVKATSLVARSSRSLHRCVKTA